MFHCWCFWILKHKYMCTNICFPNIGFPIIIFLYNFYIVTFIFEKIDIVRAQMCLFAFRSIFYMSYFFCIGDFIEKENKFSTMCSKWKSIGIEYFTKIGDIEKKRKKIRSVKCDWNNSQYKWKWKIGLWITVFIFENT